MADSKQDILRDTLVEDIYGDYRNGLITRGSMNKALREKARLLPMDDLQKYGFLGGVYQQTIANAQDAWDQFIDGLTKKKMAAYDDTMGRFLWFNFKIASALPSAIIDMTGAQAERMALDHGASPGVARGIGLVTEIGANFLPTRALARGLQKGVEKAAQTMPSAVRKAEEAADIAQKEAEAAKKVIDKVIEESLEADGLVIETIQATATEPVKTLLKAADPLKRNKRPKLSTATLPEEIMDGLDKLKAVIPKFEANPTATELNELRKLARAALKEGTQDAEIAFAKHTAAFFSPQTGEKLNYSKQMMNLLKEWAPEMMAKGDIRGAMQVLARDISYIKVKPISGGAGFVNKVRQDGGFFGGIREVFTNMLLPMSATAAFVGNSTALSAAIAKRSMISPTEGFYLTKGMTLAVGDAFKAFGNVYFKQYTGPIGRQMGPGRFDFPVVGPVPGTLGRIIRKPTETVVGVDNLFTVLFTRGSHYAMAYREADRLGLGMLQRGQFIKNQVAKPSDEMIKEAKRFSEENTFQNQLGPLARSIQKVLHFNINPATRELGEFRPGAYYFTFIKSAINLNKYAWDHTPGLQMLSAKLYRDMAAGGVRGDDAAARLIMGNLLGMYFYELAKEGWITGRGPADPELMGAWLAAGNKPHSFKTPLSNNPISHKMLEPFSTVASMIADFAMIQDQLDKPTAMQMGHAVVLTIVGNMGNNVWWGDAVQISDAVSGNMSEERSKKIFAQPLVSATGTILPAIARIIDPVTREARTWQEQIINRIPVWSKELKPLRDVYGDKWIPSRPIISSWFNLLGSGWPKTADTEVDPLKKLGARLQAKIPNFPDSIGVGPVESSADITPERPGELQPMSRLTNEEKDKWQRLTSSMLRDPRFGLEAQLNQHPFWNLEGEEALPAAGKAAFFEGTVLDIRNAAKERLILEDKGLAKKIFQNEADAEIRRLPMNMRPPVERALEEGLSIYDSLSVEELTNIMKWGDASDDNAADEPLQLNVAPSR